MVGRMQNINIDVSSYPGTTICVTIMNYLINLQSYTINYQQSAYCPTCQNGGASIIPLGSFRSICQCTNCNVGFQGNLCHIPSYQLVSPNKTPISFTTPAYVAVTIPSSSNSIKSYYQVSSGASVYVYVQFKQFTSEEAGTLNYVSNGMFSLNDSAPNNTVDINPQGSIAIGIYNYGATPVTFTIWYEESSASNILVIVLGVLGGVLFIALVVAACYIARRASRNSSLVNPNSLQVGEPGNENKLSDT